MSFQELEGYTEPLGELSAEDVAFEGEELSDEAALTIVTQDVNKAEQYLGSKNRSTDWDTADNLFRAFVKPRLWPGSDTPRSNLGMPLVLETIETVLPSIQMAFFSDAQPFLLSPKGKTTAEAARAKSNVLCWAIKQASFKEEIRKILKSILLYGFGVGKWGWETKTRKIKQYKRKPTADSQDSQNGQAVPSEQTYSDEVEVVETEQRINQPTLDYVDLRNLLVDPSCRTQDIRTANYVIQQFYVNAEDLDAMRETDGYKNIPTREELAVILAAKSEPTTNSLASSTTNVSLELQAEGQDKETSVDPLKQPLEILEYWCNDRVITVLQRKIVIRNDENEFGQLPFVSAAFIDVLGSMYGFGIAKLLEGEQKFEQGVLNTWIDNLALTLNPAYQQVQTVGTGAQQNVRMSPGKILTSPSELKPLTTTSVTTEAMNAIQTSEARANRRVGANGGDNLPTQALRTAEGVNAYSAGVTSRIQYFVEIFADLVFIPVLEAFIQMCKDKLKPSQVNQILTDADGKAYDGDVLDMYNGAYSVEVLSSTKLAGRRAMVTMIPFITQLFQAEPVQDSLTQQGKKVDYAELIEMAADLAGWDVNTFIVDMTDDDKKRAKEMNSPAAVKAIADQQKMEQKHQYDLENIQAQGEARAGVKVVGHLLKESSEG